MQITEICSLRLNAFLLIHLSFASPEPDAAERSRRPHNMSESLSVFLFFFLLPAARFLNDSHANTHTPTHTHTGSQSSHIFL